jgi:multicomponent Na+:H+ antiporter subunit D
VGGLLRASPVLAALFLLAALSLAGMPPSSGFIGKLALAQAGLAVGAYLTVAVSLGVSILTLYSMTKIWAGVFWGRFELHPEAELAASQAAPRLMVASTALLVAASVAFVVFAGPLYSFSEVAASGLIDPSVYVSAVTR